ncbi:hypothetical protein [Lacticaseibacillus sharpeae]|uniref:Uncharacterized protein n=1 Tax=Lacticaseibacillus sharpeae JCM 1186 = DSM 20505 TaxID=1291052 RepID=A0A0R1ZQM9_9LACO|nr:hypothetical protein [Lacticaseibacillus sharpeae]KRM56674.1 hypothetical protein FC18_GL001809 [Lacticaseibacillus sharpeae JCM 1186 = DSM 20505]
MKIDELVDAVSLYPIFTISSEIGDPSWSLSTVDEAFSGGGLAIMSGASTRNEAVNTDNVDGEIDDNAVYAFDWEEKTVYAKLGCNMEDCLQMLEDIFIDCAYVNDPDWEHRLVPAELLPAYQVLAKKGTEYTRRFSISRG